MNRSPTFRLFWIAMLCTALNGFGGVDDGLIGYWPLNGDALDVSGNDYHGTLLSGASFVANPEGPAQVLQTALGDQHTGYVLVGLPSSEHPGQGQIGFVTSGSVWVMFDDRQGMSHAPEWNSVLGHPPGLNYVSRNMSQDQIWTMVRTQENTQGLWARSAVSSVAEEGRWYHVAWTFHSHSQSEEGHLRWYIDGKLSAEYTGGVQTSGTNTFRIGADYSARAANTKIAEVRLYDRILTPTEIQELASAAAFSHVPQYPDWWQIPSETSQQFDYVLGVPESDFAPLALGQLKYLAAKARDELDTVLAPIGGAGTEITTMVDAFTQNDPADYAPVNLGQLKYIAAPFYNRLHAVDFDDWPGGMTFNSSGYPWTDNVTDENFSAANIGQLKYLFNWQVPAGYADSQPGEFPQWWIDQYFPGQTDVDPNADPDGDGLTNWEEFLAGTAPTNPDTDGDGMPDGWEIAHGLNPLDSSDGLEDADGDRVPNLWEYMHGTDPTDAQSVPAAPQVVAATGGTHTTLQAAYDAAGDFAIIAVKSGAYQGNLYTQWNGGKHILWLGEQGGAQGPVELTFDQGWAVMGLYENTVMDGFVFRNNQGPALYVENARVRLVNCLIVGNRSGDYAGGVYVGYSSDVELVHCTLAGNEITDIYGYGIWGGNAIYVEWGSSLAIINSILWNPSNIGTPEIEAYGTVTVTNSIVRGGQHGGIDQDPALAYGGWMTAISPAREMGVQSWSARDIHGELRPTALAPDLGCDQFVDSNGNGLPDWLEALGITDPAADQDGDGLSNLDEYQTYGTDPFNWDTDGDGLSDGDEVLIHGTNPLSTDTDGDGMPDGWEVQHGLNPLVDDANDDLDGDGLTNLWEYTHGFDPSDPTDAARDTSGNGIPDWWEVTHFGGFGNVDAAADPDGDGLTNLQEFQYGTDPNNWDTDGDLLPDGWEVQYGLDPLDPTGDNGANGDPDGDGLTNLEELIHGTNPMLADTDGDGVNDGIEVNQGSNPNNASDGGIAPPADEMVSVPFSVGDPSGSHSERWQMVIQGEGPTDFRPFEFVSPNFGQMATRSFLLRRGNSYRITVNWLATNRQNGPDYDWQAQVDGKPSTTVLAGGQTYSEANRFAAIADGWLLDNEDGLLGRVNQSFGPTNHAAGKVARLLPVDVSSHVPTALVDRDGNLQKGNKIARADKQTASNLQFVVNDDNDHHRPYSSTYPKDYDLSGIFSQREDDLVAVTFKFPQEIETGSLEISANVDSVNPEARAYIINHPPGGMSHPTKQLVPLSPATKIDLSVAVSTDLLWKLASEGEQTLYIEGLQAKDDLEVKLSFVVDGNVIASDTVNMQILPSVERSLRVLTYPDLTGRAMVFMNQSDNVLRRDDAGYKSNDDRVVPVAFRQDGPADTTNLPQAWRTVDWTNQTLANLKKIDDIFEELVSREHHLFICEQIIGAGGLAQTGEGVIILGEPNTGFMSSTHMNVLAHEWLHAFGGQSHQYVYNNIMTTSDELDDPGHGGNVDQTQYELFINATIP